MNTEIIRNNPWTLSEDGSALTRTIDKGHTQESLAAATEVAADDWASAAGAHGAYAPAHVAQVLDEQYAAPSLLEAAIEGTKRALAQHEAEASAPITPRGLDLHMRGGVVTMLIWDSENSFVTLRDLGGAWLVEISKRDSSPVMRCRRAWAVLSDGYQGDMYLSLDNGMCLDVDTEGDIPMAGGESALKWVGLGKLVIAGASIGSEAAS